MSQPDVSDYRLAPLLVARIVGTYLVLLALVMFTATALVAVAGWPADLLVLLLVAGVAGMFAVGWWLRSRAYVVRLDADGYRVGLVRGAGVRSARWADVTEAVTTRPRGAPCLELQLRAGGSSVIPAGAMAADRDDFVREVQQRLQHGHGLRRL